MALYSQIKYQSSEVLVVAHAVAASYIQLGHCLNSSLPWPGLRVFSIHAQLFLQQFLQISISYNSLCKFKCNTLF